MYAPFRTIGYGYEEDPRSSGKQDGHSRQFRGLGWRDFLLGEAYGIVDYLERGWDDYQDVLFVKKKERDR